MNTPMEALYQNTDAAKLTFDIVREHMKTKLAKKPEIFESLIPDFAVGCKRLTPGPGVSSSLLFSSVLFHLFSFM
jgi:hypothetical protein